jgi:putative addiction module killer protein
MVYNNQIEVHRTSEYDSWIRGLKDSSAKGRILARVARLELGNSGDTKALGGGLYELRIDYGPGYRVYFANINGALILLLLGGNKPSQQRDITKARKLLIRERTEDDNEQI